MKRSDWFASHLLTCLRPLLSGGIWVTVQQRQSFQGMTFCFGTPTLFCWKQTSDFFPVSRQGFCQLWSGRGHSWEERVYKTKCLSTFHDIFFLYIFLYIFLFLSHLNFHLHQNWYFGIWCLRGQLVMNLWVFLFCSFVLHFSFFLYFILFFIFWCDGATVRSGCKNSVSSGHMAFCWSCSWWELVRNWVLMSSHMVTSGWSNSFKGV